MSSLMIFLFISIYLCVSESNAATVGKFTPFAISEQRNSELIYEGCGTTKTCFGLPSGCVELQSCQAVVTAVVLNNRYQFELKSGVANVAYVALGLSWNDRMGDASVMECIPENGIIRTYSSWNNARSNTREGVPQNITSLIDSSYVDGTIYCKLERESLTTILGNEFDLANENFYFLIAFGTTVTDSSLTHHDLGRIASSEPLDIVRKIYDHIYEGCGTSKTCFGLPSGCVEDQSCQAIVTAVVLNNRYEFELQSGVANVGYVALGLSRNAVMGDTSVMECIPEGDIIRTYSSWNYARANTREGVPQNITSLLDSSFVDATIYCKLERELFTTILGNEFDLVNERFHFLIAIGTTATGSSLTRHDLGRIASSEPLDIVGERINDPIYEGCGTTKTCFGLPNDCVEEQSCQAVVTAVYRNSRYEFELQSGVANVGYVALGLSRNDRMGDTSVMECIPEGGIIRTFSSWNNARANTREGVPQNITSLVDSSYIDGTIYCKLEREALTTILESEFDLVNESFHFLVAIGTTVTASSLTRHDLGRIASSEPLDIVGGKVADPIYEGCGTTKTCFGLPNDCVEEQSCQAVVTAVFLNSRYEFELKSGVANVGYVALGLSRNAVMGDTSVMECIPEGGIIRTYSSWNYARANTREGVPQNITSLIDSSYVDGTIYCKLERETLTTILGSEFDLVNESFHFLVAIGTTVTASSLTRHDLGRISSSEPLDIVGEERINDPIYEGCGTTKTCFGMPSGCVEDQSCQAIATAVVLYNRNQFELQSNVANVAYVALGLSRDDQMGDDAVMECVAEGGIIRAYSSWNYPRPGIGNTRDGVPQNFTSLIDSSYIDGKIYCKLERQSLTTILGNEFDLVNENFHFLVAIGTAVAASSLRVHDLGRIASSEPLDIVGEHIDDPIYEGCETTKTCFGLPSDCIEQQSCQAVVTAAVLDNQYLFELKSRVPNAAYIAFGLSRDAQMGEDSVMECIPEGGVIRTYSSWNNPRPSLGNTRQGVPQDMTSLINSSYIDGVIYCKLERQSSTTILGNEFNLNNGNFHFLIAIGTTVTTDSSLTRHDLGRIASSEPFDFVGSGHVPVKISTIAIIVWFLTTNYTNYSHWL